MIIDESPLSDKKSKFPIDKLMQISVAYEEYDIRNSIKTAGGRWNNNEKVWELPYSDVLSLGLENRIVNNGERNVN